MTPLTDEQKNEAALIASVGCDRETAAKYVGCSPAELALALRDDPGFDSRYRRAESQCELAHMRNIQQAARDEKHWRASVWWLERRLPDRFGRREPEAVGRRELARFLGAVAGGAASAVRSEPDRRRLLDKLAELAESLNDPLWIESHAPPPEDPDPDQPEPTE